VYSRLSICTSQSHVCDLSRSPGNLQEEEKKKAPRERKEEGEKEAKCPSRRGAIPSQTDLLELLLQARHVQAIDSPATRLTLAMQDQRTHVSKDLATARGATDKRMQYALVHPLLHLDDIDAAGADVGVHIKVHVERRVPPLTQTAQEKGGLAEIAAAAGLEVVDEAGVGAHWCVAAPAGYVGRAVFGHVLLVYAVSLSFAG